MTIFTFEKVGELREIANKALPLDMNVMGKKISGEKLDQIARAIEKQKPHDLSKFFGMIGLNRRAILNKQKLISLCRIDDW